MKSLVVLLLSLATAWSDEICCSYGGCYDDNYPYDHLPLPTCASDIGPVFNLYTRSNRDNPQSLTRNSIPSAFSGSKMTVFIIHGWIADENLPWMKDMKDAFLDVEDMNVVHVGWSEGAFEPFYPKSASNTRTVGGEVGMVMDNIKNNGGSAASRIHCAGHSLGSHVCGHAGRWTSIDRITGMDPAGPMFENYPLEVSLNPDAASFVDVLHTGGKGYALNLGSLRVMGHMDFYPNEGGDQPGCDGNGCDHDRCHQFFIESIKSDCFVARSRCTNGENIPGSCTDCGGACARMGYNSRGSGSNGLYYLTTNAAPPYCQN